MSFISLSKQSTNVVKLLTVSFVILAFTAAALAAEKAAPASAAKPDAAATTKPETTSSSSSDESNNRSVDPRRSYLGDRDSVEEADCNRYRSDRAKLSGKCNVACQEAVGRCSTLGAVNNETSRNQLLNILYPMTQVMGGVTPTGNTMIQPQSGNKACELSQSELRTEKRDLERQMDDYDRDISKLSEGRNKAKEEYEQELRSIDGEDRSIREQIRKLEKLLKDEPLETAARLRAKQKERDTLNFNLQRQSSQMIGNISSLKNKLAAETRKQVALLIRTTIDRIKTACINKVKEDYSKMPALAKVSNNLKDALKLKANQLSNANKDLQKCIEDAQTAANDALEESKAEAMTIAENIDRLEDELARMQEEASKDDARLAQEIADLITSLQNSKDANAQELAELYKQLNENITKRNQALENYKLKIQEIDRQGMVLNQKKSMKSLELQGLGARPSGLGKGSVSDAIESVNELQALDDAYALKCTGKAPVSDLLKPAEKSGK